MEDEQLKEYELAMKNAELDNKQNQLNQYQQQLVNEEDKSMIADQLDLGEKKDMIYKLLKGHVLRKDKQGRDKWVESDDPDMKILTDFGVDYIISAIQWYLNKNTLLSNYDEETIRNKMEDFSTVMADYMFMHYEKMFNEPTLEECKEEVEKRIDKKVKIKIFSLEIAGQEANEKELRNEILKQMKGTIIRELDIIKQQKMKGRLKRFESILRFVQDSVHSTYQRAWKGAERTSLRQHMHISETKGGPSFSSPQKSGMFSWLKRK